MSYTEVNGVNMYWESRGSGGPPLIVTHGGFGLTTNFGDLLDQLAELRQVIAVELQGHGHTADIDRPFSWEAFGDDLGELIHKLELGPVDLLGYSLGGSATLRCVIQHPDGVGRVAIVSAPCRRDGSLPEAVEGMNHVSSAGFEQMKHTPMYAEYRAVAPDPSAFPALMDKTGALLRQPYDWTDEVRRITAPTLLVFGDADSIPPSHAAQFFGLLGGGQQDGGFDGSLPTPMRLAILPGLTHYNIATSPALAKVATDFFRP